MKNILVIILAIIKDILVVILAIVLIVLFIQTFIKRNKEYSVTLQDIDYRTSQYNEAMYRITELKKDETLYLYFHSPGGYLGDGYRLINNIIYSTKGRVVCVLNSQAASMGAVIFLNCPTKIVRANSSLMLHLPYNVYSNGSVVQWSGVKADSFVSTLKVCCSKWITEGEFKELRAGKDVYISGEVLQYRLRYGLTKEK